MNESNLVDSNEKNLDRLKDNIRQSRALERMTKAETLKLRQKHIGASVALFFQENPLKIVRGHNQYLYDELGNEYLDCINNVAHVGHANPKVAAAVGEQMQVLNTNARFLHDNLCTYAQRLCNTMPSHLSVCYLVNSGSEANDLAIRLARAHTKRTDIVCVDGAYHGNLSSTMSISPFKTHKLPASGRAPHWADWAHVAPMPCAYRGEFATTKTTTTTTASNEQQVGRLYAQASRALIQQVHASGRKVAAMFVESMISCGGQFPLPSNYLRHLQQYLHENGSLLVCDEVQTGFGRCGKSMWAFQMDGDDIKPDIVTLGKPMGNGFPVAAVVTTSEIAQSFKSIGTDYFNTFGGNPVSCAAAIAVLDELRDKRLQRHADLVGSFLMDQLERLKCDYPNLIGDVRGAGFFIGCEIVSNGETREPSPKSADYIVRRLRDERILMSTEGKLGNVLKFKPPMVFTMDNARLLLQVLERTLKELAESGPIEDDDDDDGNNDAKLKLTSTRQNSDLNSDASSGCSSTISSASSSASWLESSSEQEL